MFSVAPMMEYTDRHCRYFLRLLSRRARLYTEMITTGAVLHGDRDRLLAFDPAESPIAVQFGGCDPEALARAAGYARGYGYGEVNLNVGCPSSRVQSARFGACLMAEPLLVAECVRAMQTCGLPVTVKTRLGIDERDSYDELAAFMTALEGAGCRTVILHARKAWLAGLSPRENRDIPPLQPEVVYRVKRDFPALEIVINGGITTLDEVERHLEHVDGVMIGREAYHNPYLLAEVDTRLFGDVREPPAREAVLESLMPYLERHLARGGRLAQVTRHTLGLFNGRPGARRWRRLMSEGAHRAQAGPELVRLALAAVRAAGAEVAQERT